MTAADIGLTRKDIQEARLLRDAELVDPGIVRGGARLELCMGDRLLTIAAWTFGVLIPVAFLVIAWFYIR